MHNSPKRVSNLGLREEKEDNQHEVKSYTNTLHSHARARKRERESSGCAIEQIPKSGLPES